MATQQKEVGFCCCYLGFSNQAIKDNEINP